MLEKEAGRIGQPASLEKGLHDMNINTNPENPKRNDAPGGSPIPPSGVNGQAPTTNVETAPAEGGSFFDDMDAMRISPEASHSTRKVLTDVGVRRPDSQEWFRIHPGEEMQITTGILVSKKDGFKDGNYYVVPGLRDTLKREMRIVTLFTAITSGGVVFLWPIGVPGVGGNSNTWQETARSACETAKTKWIRVIADTEIGKNVVVESEEDHPDPKWPEKTFQDFVKLAFKDKVIDSLEHPVVRGLRRVPQSPR